MKKILGILLAVCFLMSVTAAAVSAGPVVVKDKKTAAAVSSGPFMVKEKKTAIIMFKDVKTKIYKWPHHHQHYKLHHHHKLMKAVKEFMKS